MFYCEIRGIIIGCSLMMDEKKGNYNYCSHRRHCLAHFYFKWQPPPLCRAVSCRAVFYFLSSFLILRSILSSSSFSAPTSSFEPTDRPIITYYNAIAVAIAIIRQCGTAAAAAVSLYCTVSYVVRRSWRWQRRRWWWYITTIVVSGARPSQAKPGETVTPS